MTSFSNWIFVFNGNTLGTFVLLVGRHRDFFPPFWKRAAKSITIVLCVYCVPKGELGTLCALSNLTLTEALLGGYCPFSPPRLRDQGRQSVQCYYPGFVSATWEDR